MRLRVAKPALKDDRPNLAAFQIHSAVLNLGVGRD